MIKKLSIYLLLLVSFAANAQKTLDRPKIVVGMVVDQMRWDYFYRYYDKYGSGGFKRVLKEAYNCHNANIPYLPTYTAPGHTCIYTGSVPALHGIVGNDFVEKYNNDKIVYCTTDTNYKSVGCTNKTGCQSPKRMMASTITDELRLATNLQAKTIGIAIKDRSSIYPAGHAANGAYWWDGKSGNFVTSTYYSDTLPKWVADFNNRKLPQTLIKDNWKTILDLIQYYESTADDKWYESTYSNEDKPVFPHTVSELTKSGMEVLKATPFGNTLTFEMAKAAIEGEKLGSGKFTDFLAVSFSSTDYIGHQFGPNAVEMEDCYIRFDRELAAFLTFLDKKYGKNNYLFFMTADHGAGHAHGFNQENHLPSDCLFTDSLQNKLNNAIAEKFHINNCIRHFINMQLFFDDAIVTANKIDKNELESFIKKYFENDPDVIHVVSLPKLSNETLPAKLKTLLENGYFPKRSGDMQLVFRPGVLEDFPKGTTHGTNWEYDTHIPVAFMGWHIKAGNDFTTIYMTDIAATIAALLHIQQPNATVGKPIQGIFKK